MRIRIDETVYADKKFDSFRLFGGVHLPVDPFESE